MIEWVKSWRRRSDANTLSLLLYEYAHVTDELTGVTELVVGPLVRRLKSHETLAKAPTPFHAVPRASYAAVRNPHETQQNPLTKLQEPVRGPDQQVRTRIGDVELRYGDTTSAFPLYPDEELEFIQPMPVLSASDVFVVKVLADYELAECPPTDVAPAPEQEAAVVCATPLFAPTAAPAGEGEQLQMENAASRTVSRVAGEWYYLRGPGVYRPRLDEEVTEKRRVITVGQHTALHILVRESAPVSLVRARGTSVPGDDGNSDQRYVYAGEEYLYARPGEFIPSRYESVTRVVSEVPLGPDEGVHVVVAKEYTDTRPFAQGVVRRAGDVFAVTHDDGTPFFLHPYDTVKRRVRRVVVSEQQYCVVGTLKRRTASPSDAPKATKKNSPIDDGDDDDREPAERAYQSRRVLTSTTFFLQPSEVMEVAPRPIHVLTADQALLLCALEDFTEDFTEDCAAGTAATASTPTQQGRLTSAGEPVRHVRGDRWLVHGPCRFTPCSHVRVLSDARTGSEVRERLILTEGEGVYVRHTSTGVVRLIAGPTSYLLEACEELWEKPLPPHVERRLGEAAAAAAAAANAGSSSTHMAAGEAQCGSCNATPSSESLLSSGMTGGIPLHGKSERGVVYHIPNRSVTQLFNYRTQHSRTIFGPNRILLEPDESFTVVSLSGSPWDPHHPNICLPKEQGLITSLYLFLGPSNMTDVVLVETSDHARLSLQLCYDWFFDVAHGDAAAASRCFVVNDFVANVCSFIAGHVRSAVASLPFEQFHERSAEVLHQAVFGVDPVTGKPATELRFNENNFVVTSVDIQEMHVLDARTRRGLQKSVKMAIEIATHAQQVAAQQAATTVEQEACGQLDRQRMSDQVANEERRKMLLETEREVLSIVTSSKSTAMAEALARAAAVESSAAVEAAGVRAEREAVVSATLLEAQRKKRLLVSAHEAQLAAAMSSLQRSLDAVRHDLLTQVVAALGTETLAEIAKAGPELQATLLKSMGLEGYLVTDGTAPINLLKTATGLTSATNVE